MVARQPRTIAFFEVVRAKDALSPRMEQVDWQQSLSALRSMNVHSRIYTGRDNSFIGQAVRACGQEHLLIGRIGTRELQTVDLDHGHIEEIRLEGNKGTIDTTTVAFLNYGNIVGIMQGKPGSPRASAIQKWMNACGMVHEEIALWPVISHNVWEKLEQATAVHSFEFSYTPSPAIPPPEGEGLSSFAQLGNARYQDHRITLKIEVPKRGGMGPVARLRGHRRLREDIHNLMSELGYLEGPTGIDRARAFVTLPTPDGDHSDEPLDFIKHHITVKCRVEVRPEDARPRYEVAAEAILGVAEQQEHNLRAAVSADR